MKTILLVTGNVNKLREWQAAMPEDIHLRSVDVDLTEIQSDDPLEIVIDKARRAYEHLGVPVIVEDVSAGLNDLGGLPGPFIKFFTKRLGNDALYILSGGKKDAQAVISCNAVYYDGANFIKACGEVKGTIVAPAGSGNFGFDFTFIPDGYDQTYAQMEPELKNRVSHRGLAIRELLQKLR